MRKNYKLVVLALAGFIAENVSAQDADFENLSLPAESYWDGSDLSGTTTPTNFTTSLLSGDFIFSNVWDTTWGAPGYWSEGIVLSSMTDSVTSGAANIYSSRAASGHNSPTYAVAKNNTTIKFNNAPNGTVLTGISITNSTYAANSMRDGDSFGKQFGGPSGDDPDWFLLTIKGLDANGDVTADSVDFYLADYRFADNSQDYIQTMWNHVDLTALGNVYGLNFTLNSSDVGQWGMNTPAFFCLDSLTSDSLVSATFEDVNINTLDSVWDGSDLTGDPDDKTYRSVFTSGDYSFNNVWNIGYGGYWQSGFAYSNMTDSVTSGSGNLYSAKAGTGAFSSSNYIVAKNNSSVIINSLMANQDLTTFYVTNSTYAYNSMRDGDAFGKKFGGASGNDPDWFMLTIKLYNNGLYVDSIDFYLADYRFADNSQDYIVKDWQQIGYQGNNVDSAYFTLSSSDVGQYGMNTPAFVCIDNIQQTFADDIVEFEKNIISFFPNPASSQININTHARLDALNIVDVSGKVVYNKANINDSQISINVSQLPAGMYFITSIAGGKKQTQKFIKE